MNGIECEEAVKDICEKCFEKYEEMYDEKPINCASEPLTTKIVQQLKF